MASPLRKTNWGYSYIPAVFQYSAGVVASDGYAIQRVCFEDWPTLEIGFDRIAQFMDEHEIDRRALCGCELRSPEPLSNDEFAVFNRKYITRLVKWGIVADNDNPVARSNVCPEGRVVEEPKFMAFSYAIKKEVGKRNFVIAGSAEVAETESGKLEDRIINYKDVSDEGILAKGIWVLNEMERRLNLVGAGWNDTNGVHVYSVHNWQEPLRKIMTSRRVIRNTLEWCVAKPPVKDLEFEMDCRCVDMIKYW